MQVAVFNKNDVVMQLALVSALFTIAAHGASARKQGMCVLGKLACPGDEPQVTKTLLKLYDRDRGNADDWMAEGHPTADGFFELCGTASDVFGDIDPVFKIYTRCNFDNDDKQCYRRLVYTISDAYINKNMEFEHEIDLRDRVDGEDTRCFTGSAIKDWFRKHLG